MTWAPRYLPDPRARSPGWRRPPTQAGFTLLEVLVVMVLLGLIVTAGFSALRLSGRSWEAGVAHGERIEEQTAGPAYLGRQLAEMVAPLWRVQGEVRLPFEGGAERLRFLAPAPASDAEAGLYQVTVERETGYRHGRLLLRLDRFDPTRQELQEPSAEEPIVLLADLEDVTLAYHGLPRTGGQEGWLEQWPADAENLPRLVRVRVKPAEDRAAPYDLSYPVRVDATARETGGAASPGGAGARVPTPEAQGPRANPNRADTRATPR